jgi:hypothetical protein
VAVSDATVIDVVAAVAVVAVVGAVAVLGVWGCHENKAFSTLLQLHL